MTPKRQWKRSTDRRPHKAAAQQRMLTHHRHAFITSLRCACGLTAYAIAMSSLRRQRPANVKTYLHNIGLRPLMQPEVESALVQATDHPPTRQTT